MAPRSSSTPARARIAQRQAGAHLARPATAARYRAIALGALLIGLGIVLVSWGMSTSSGWGVVLRIAGVGVVIGGANTITFEIVPRLRAHAPKLPGDPRR